LPNHDLHQRYLLCQQIINQAKRQEPEFGQYLAEKFSGPWAKLQEAKRQQGLLASFNDSYMLSYWPNEEPFIPKEFNRNHRMIGLGSKSVPPQVWLQQAMQVYAASFPGDIAGTLWFVGERDRAVADQLFLFLLQRIQADETAGPVQMLALMAYPFGDHQFVFTDGLGSSTTHSAGGLAFYGSIPAPLPRFNRPALGRDEWLVYRFLQTALVVLQRTLSADLTEFPNAQSRLGTGLCLLLWLAPRVAALQPRMSPTFQQFTQAFSQRVTALQQAQIQNRLQNGWGRRAVDYDVAYRRDFPNQPLPVEAPPIDMLNVLTTRAEKAANPNERDYFYQEAALFADREGPAEQALPLAEKISALEYRRAVRAWLSFNAARVALERGDYARAQRLAEDLTAVDQRILILSRIAAAWTAKQREKALNLFNDLETELRKADNSAETLRAWLLLVNSLTKFDRQRAVDALDELTRAANKLANFTLNDLRMTRALQHPAGVALAWPRVTSETLRELDWQQPFTTLAREDFDQVFGLVQAIEDRPLKVSAWLAVAAQLAEQKIKAPTPEPALKK
jgi:hypothetical protein